MDNTGGMSFAEMLAQPGVVEEVSIRGTFGFLAYHGGPVERVTSLIAREAARRSDSSFYSIDQPAERPLHIPSTRVDPAESPQLAAVLEHVDVVCTLHGYGRDMNKVLLGGQNRELAQVVHDELTKRLEAPFEVVVDLDEIPVELRGVHPKNPVNLPRNQGVQIELPPALRWNADAHKWGDAPGLEMTAGISAVVNALVAAVKRWPY